MLNILVAGWVAFSCGGVFAAEPAAGTYTHDEGRLMLRAELVEFEQYIQSTMSAARRILTDRGASAQDLEKLDAWQEAQKARFQYALRQDDPLVALEDAWAVGRSLAAYLDKTGTRDELSAPIREVALDMLKRREDRLAYIASRYLAESSLATLSQQLDGYTEDHVISNTEILESDSRRWTSPLFSVWTKGRAVVGGAVELPLVPGRALKGVAQGGKALSGIDKTTARAVEVAGELPERIRIEFQAALTNLVEKRTELLEFLNSADSTSSNLRETADSVYLTATEIQESLILAQKLAPQGESLAAAVERAMMASGDLVKALDDYSARNFERSSDREPFNVSDCESAAESIQKAAVEVRALIHELNGMSIDETSAEYTVVRLRGLIDHFTMRCIQVAVVVFFLACIHTFVFRKKKKEQAK